MPRGLARQWFWWFSWNSRQFGLLADFFAMAAVLLGGTGNRVSLPVLDYRRVPGGIRLELINFPVIESPPAKRFGLGETREGVTVEQASVAEQVAKQLAPYLGPFNARVAVKTYAKATLQLLPEGITLDQLPALLGALRPMLVTFAGQTSTDLLLAKIKREVQ